MPWCHVYRKVARGAPQIHRINVLYFFRRHENIVELELVAAVDIRVCLNLGIHWYTPAKTRTFSATTDSGEMDFERLELRLSDPSRPIFGTPRNTCILSFSNCPFVGNIRSFLEGVPTGFVGCQVLEHAFFVRLNPANRWVRICRFQGRNFAKNRSWQEVRLGMVYEVKYHCPWFSRDHEIAIWKMGTTSCHPPGFHFFIGFFSSSCDSEPIQPWSFLVTRHQAPIFW